MATSLSTSPQIADDSAPLDVLILRALRRYGEMAPSTVDGETSMMFMDYANAVVDDVLSHPYWQTGVDVPYYNHITERRGIPDTILLAGLVARYALDKSSKKAQAYEMEYNKRMNQVLARTRFGASPVFEVQVIDYNTNTSGSSDPGVN